MLIKNTILKKDKNPPAILFSQPNAMAFKSLSISLDNKCTAIIIPTNNIRKEIIGINFEVQTPESQPVTIPEKKTAPIIPKNNAAKVASSITKPLNSPFINAETSNAIKIKSKIFIKYQKKNFAKINNACEIAKKITFLIDIRKKNC